MSGIVTAALIIIGNEILSGRTRDDNLPYVARRCTEIGVRLAEVRVVADDADAIANAVNDCRAAHDYVFTTGGIGPTHDDITVAAVATAFGVEVVRDAEAVRRLTAFYEGGDLELNEARLKMADAPAGAAIVDNPVSGAPGFRIENVYVMAGVPEIMQAMFEGAVREIKGGDRLRARTVTVDLPEGTIAATLAAVQERYADVEIGSYPYSRSRAFGVKVVLRGVDEARLDAAAAALIEALAELGGNPALEEEGADAR